MLKFGKFPILLDNDVCFEGEANIKFLPIKLKNKQIAICYDSSRSDTKAIDNINHYLKKLRLPLIDPIILKPKKDKRKDFYHLDCIINFTTDNTIQHFNSKLIFLIIIIRME